MGLMDLTDGWLVDWSQRGGRFKEWVRGMHLDAINHGWIRTIATQPMYWWRAVRHIASWIPVLWDDCDWDQADLWIMMREKLRRMRACHTGKEVEELMVAEELLGRLIKDDYCAMEWENHRLKYGDPWPLVSSDKIPVKHPYDPVESEEMSKIIEKEEATRKEDSRYLCQWLHKCWFRWWV